MPHSQEEGETIKRAPAHSQARDATKFNKVVELKHITSKPRPLHTCPWEEEVQTLPFALHLAGWSCEASSLPLSHCLQGPVVCAGFPFIVQFFTQESLFGAGSSHHYLGCRWRWQGRHPGAAVHLQRLRGCWLNGIWW